MEEAGICPGLSDLAAYCDGLLSGEPLERLEEHLAVCPECLRISSESVAARDRVRETSSPVAARHPGFRRVAAAAILLGLGAGGAALLRGGWGTDRVERVLTGRWAPRGAGEASLLSVGEPLSADGQGDLLLPDDTRGTVGAGASLRLMEPGPGERLRVRLDCGEAEWSVVPGRPGRVVVETPLGEVRVAGTRFVTRLWRDPLADAGASGAARLLEVDVAEGGVAASPVSGGEVAIVAGEVALLASGRPPQRIVVAGASSPRWASENARKLEEAVQAGDRAEVLLSLVRLQRTGEAGVAALRERAADEARSEEECALWGALLAAVDPGVE